MAIHVEIKKNLHNYMLDVSLHSTAKCLGILGASGCGKSMTLKSMAGLIKPDEGRVEVDGRILFDSSRNLNVKANERKVGYLFQNYALFPNMTVEENIAIVLGKKKAGEQLEELIHLFRIEEIKNYYPSELSGGQQQRVAIARIFAYDPDVILLDEPFSALDSYMKGQMEDQLFELLASFKGQILMVSHSREELYTFCEELAVMDEGKIIVQGPTKEVFQNPVKLQAAKLSGCKNLYEAIPLDDHTLFVEELGVSLQTGSRIGEEITHVGIRAHHIRIGSGAAGENTMEGTIRKVKEAPFEQNLLVQTGQGMLWIKQPKDHLAHYQAGDKLPVQLPKEELLLLQ